MKWLVPISLVAIGIAVLSGFILKNVPGQGFFRQTFGLVIILIGVYRYFAARIPKVGAPRRRFGGVRKRPWEPDEH